MTKKLICSLLIAAAIIAIGTGCSKKKTNQYDVDNDPKPDQDTVTDEDPTPVDDTEPATDEDPDTEPATDEVRPRPDGDTGEPQPDEDSGDSGNDDTDTGDSQPDGDSSDTQPDETPGTPDEDEEITYNESSLVPCTGLKRCYEDEAPLSSCPSDETELFFGQDYFYHSVGMCKPRDFEFVKGVTRDNLTGLYWQKDLPVTYDGCTKSDGRDCTYEEAASYCENLVIEDLDEWRLPTVEELLTIVDFGNVGPAIDTAFFPGTEVDINYNYWTNSTYSPTPSLRLAVDFRSGAVSTMDPESSATSGLVRCVSGDPYRPNLELITETPDVVIDLNTNLVWAKTASENIIWRNALDFCNSLVFAGYSDWRLPNINELKTLFSSDFENPSSYLGLPENASSNIFWSSTTYAGAVDKAWLVDFKLGTDTRKKVQTAGGFPAICIRSAD